MKVYGLGFCTAVMLLATPTTAQTPTCLSREVIVERLEGQYKEKLAGRGLRGQGSLFEMFVAADGSSWTIVQSFASGRSCIMAAGTDWMHNDLKTAFSVDG